MTTAKNSRSNTALTVAGAIVLVLAALVLAAAGAALWANGKSDGGYVSTGKHRFDASTHAIYTDSFKVTATFPAGSSGVRASPRRRPAASRCSSASRARATSMRTSPT